MKLFLSWSGEKSRLLGLALKEWLPLVVQYVDPWLSDRDIAAGNRWPIEVARELEGANFGILCLTRENLNAPWILFEAGALSKIVSASSVCPYLLAIEFAEISGPLSQFQAKKADKAGTLDLLRSINDKAPRPLDPVRLVQVFEGLWPSLEARLSEISKNSLAQKVARPQVEVLEDLVGTVRGLEHRLRSLEASLVREASPVRPVSGRSQKIEVQVQGAFPGAKDGTNLSFEPGLDPPSAIATFLEDVALVVDASAEEYGRTWHLKDSNSDHILTQEEAENPVTYFGKRSRQLTLAKIAG